MSAPATYRRPVLPRVFFAAGAGAIAACSFLIAAGWTYYRLPIDQRPFHSDHAALRPSGSLGLSYGLAGTALMLLNLGYLVRKRLVTVRWLGSLRSWMAFHLLTGLVGPAFIVLHSALQPSSALGTLALAAMLVAVATGVVGRYIYAHMPRSLEGRELELEEVRKRLDRYRVELGRLGVQLPAAAVEVSARGGEGLEVVGAFRALLAADRESRRDFERFRRDVLASEALRPRARAILPLARALSRERQRIARFLELKFLMSSWRFFHRWLAIVMLLVVLFHVALAFAYGDLWILRGRKA